MGIYGGGGEVPPIVPGTPACGWEFSPEQTVLEFTGGEIVLSFSSEQTVSVFEDC